jgi:hypothetical protein
MGWAHGVPLSIGWIVGASPELLVVTWIKVEAGRGVGMHRQLRTQPTCEAPGHEPRSHEQYLPVIENFEQALERLLQIHFPSSATSRLTQQRLHQTGFLARIRTSRCSGVNPSSGAAILYRFRHWHD